MKRTPKTFFAVAAALLIGTGIYEVTPPSPEPPKISEDVAAVIDYMQDVDTWTLDKGASWAFHSKTRIAVYASRYSDLTEIRIDVPSNENYYAGVAVPLRGNDGYAFTKASIKLHEYLIAKRRPALTDYVGRLKNGGS